MMFRLISLVPPAIVLEIAPRYPRTKRPRFGVKRLG